ncbi:MAG: aromatic acid/H+ symport family MFS transporter [Solibacillus sp.]
MQDIHVQQLIAKSKFSKFHFILLFWSFVIIAFDGYDLVLYGTVVPVLIEEWGISSIYAGTLSSYGLFGMLFGAIGFGILADQIGRKKVIVITVILFSLFTGLCGFTNSPELFGIFRFAAGLGLGGIMPNIIALLTDYSPRKYRGTIVAIVLCGYSIGGIFAPILGITLMPVFGWESILWVAFLPMLLLPVIFISLPETPRYLLKKGRVEELVKTLQKMAPNEKIDASMNFIIDEVVTEKSGPSALFSENRTLSTLLFWLAFFSCLLMVYGLNTWLPNLMIQAGYGLTSSLVFLIALQGGAIIGSLIMGPLADKIGFKKVLIPMYASGAIALTLLGFGGNQAWIFFLVMVAGAATIGSQNIVQAYVSQYYPAYIRSTALGTSSGIGRIGGMMGPILGGVLLGMTLPNYQYFLAFAIPGAIAAIAISCVPSKNQKPSPPKDVYMKEPTPKTI